MFDVMADWMSVPLINTEAGKTPPRMGLSHPSIAPYGAFRSKDGKDILISIQSEREWKVFCAIVMDDATLADDPRFCTMVVRVTNREATDEAVGDVFASLTRDQLIARLDKADIAYGEVNSAHDLVVASAPAAHRDRHARRPRRAARARADLRRREPQLRRRAAGRRATRKSILKQSGRSHECDRNARSRSSAQVDRQGRGGRPTSSPRARCKGMRATLFLDPGEPKAGDAAP